MRTVMAGSTRSDYVILRDGRPLPLAVVRLAWRLEAEGLTIKVNGRRLYAGPREHLRDRDRVALKRHREDVIALMRDLSHSVST